MIGRLVVRSQPLASEESLSGYLLRMASANVRNVRTFFDGSTGLSRSVVSRSASLRRLADLLGVEEKALVTIACWPLGDRPNRVSFGPEQTLFSGERRLVAGAFCHECLSETGVLARFWQVRAVTACPRHRIHLTSRCSHCGRVAGWARKYLFACDCGFDLRRSVRSVASSPCIEVAAALDCLHRGNEPVAPDGLDFAVAARLVWFCGTWGSNDPAQRRSMFLSRPSPEAAVSIVEAGADALLAFPAGFHRWLSSVVSRSDYQLRRAFGGSLAPFRSAFPDGPVPVILDEMRRWFSTEWTGSCPSWNSPFHGVAPAHRMLPLTVVARQTGVSASRLRKLVAAEAVSSRTTPVGGRVSVLIDTRTIQGMIGSQRKLTWSEAAKALGISPAGLKRVRAAGLLGECQEGDRRTTTTPQMAVDLFARRIGAVAIGADPPPGSISLEELAARRQVSSVAILARVLSGELPAWLRSGSTPTVSRLVILLEDALRDQERGSTLSVREAARELQVSTRMVPVLLRAGCLEESPRAIGDGVGTKRTISAPSVCRLRRDFALTRTVSQRLHTSTRKAIGLMLASGARPVVGHDSKLGISAVWRVEDMDRLVRNHESRDR